MSKVEYDSYSWTGIKLKPEMDYETTMWLEAFEDSLCQVSAVLWRVFPEKWKVRIAGNLAGWHYGLYESESYGNREADIACRDRIKQEWVEEERAALLGYVRLLMSDVDNGSSRVFDVMTHDQRIAMHKLFNFEEFYAKEVIRK